MNAMATIDRSVATRECPGQIANLEQDSFSADPNMNSEVSVSHKINAAMS